MELREIYETLLRRGMPEHPRLAHTYDGYAPIWVLTGDSDERLELATFGDPLESDARDLITMHALRWHLGMRLRGTTKPVFIGPEDSMVLVEELRRGKVLELIVEETARLEPKKTLA